MNPISRTSARDPQRSVATPILNESHQKSAVATQVETSEQAGVTAERRDHVGGVASDRAVNLSQYRHLLNGSQLPPMTQLMSAEKPDEAASMPPLLGEETQRADQADEEAGEAQDLAEERSETRSSKEAKSPTGEELSEEELSEVSRLKARDQEVRTHEQAHVSAGGQYIRGGISYEYQRGPDGKNYAVGGHVDIDVSAESTPEATINKMRVVKRAALAPAEPSGADRAVAAEAANKEQQARSEIAETQQREAVERRAEASKPKESAQEGQATEAAQSAQSDNQAIASSTSPSDSSENGVSVPVPSPPSPPQSSGPRSPEMMNLARESRMRIKRGISWLG